MSIPNIPKRKIILPRILKKDYSYSEILESNISSESINSVIFSKNDLDKNMSKIIELINDDISIKCLDFDSVMFLDKILNNKVENKIILVDDGLRISREYIDLSKLKNINLCVPLSYLLWGVSFNNSVDTYCFKLTDFQTGNFNYTSINGNENITLDNLKKVRDTLDQLSKYNVKSEAEKVALISDFIQSKVQYINGYESESSRGIFITPQFPVFDEYRKKSGLIETVNNSNNGVCVGISNLATLLLNNEVFNCEVESVYAPGHVWNKVLIDGKYYYFDNTWSITRSEDTPEDSLITLSFQKQYLLFGLNTANNIGHHNQQSISVYNNGVMSEEDYNMLQYNSKFQYNQTSPYKSFRKK